MRLDPEVYRRAKIVAEALRKELEPLVLGQKREAWSCGCDAIKNGVSTAIEIEPAGMDPRYENQIGLWYMWTVKMREDDKPALEPGNYSYSLGVSDFVKKAALKEMFHRHFDGVGVRTSSD